MNIFSSFKIFLQKVRPYNVLVLNSRLSCDLASVELATSGFTTE